MGEWTFRQKAEKDCKGKKGFQTCVTKREAYHRSWHRSANKWIEDYAMKSYSAQLATHKKKGRVKKTLKFDPSGFLDDFTEAMGDGDEHLVKHMKLHPQGYGADTKLLT